jgi:hypothetical protein
MKNDEWRIMKDELRALLVVDLVTVGFVASFF